MDLATFPNAVRLRPRFTSTARDPLAAAWSYLDEHGETAEAATLRKVIRALASMRGEFDESELWLFSTETTALVAALADARIEGQYPELEWWADV